MQPIPEGLNPATWMLEVTMPGNEDRLGVDFSQIYANSSLSGWASIRCLPHLLSSVKVA